MLRLEMALGGDHLATNSAHSHMVEAQPSIEATRGVEQQQEDEWNGVEDFIHGGMAMMPLDRITYGSTK